MHPTLVPRRWSCSPTCQRREERGLRLSLCARRVDVLRRRRRDDADRDGGRSPTVIEVSAATSSRARPARRRRRPARTRPPMLPIARAARALLPAVRRHRRARRARPAVTSLGEHAISIAQVVQDRRVSAGARSSSLTHEARERRRAGRARRDRPAGRSCATHRVDSGSQADRSSRGAACIFGDTDQMGVVYYAHYLRFFESGRAEYWRAPGAATRTSRRRQPAAGGRGALRYKRPARYDDLLAIEADPTVLRAASSASATPCAASDQSSPKARHARLIDAEGRPRRFPKTAADPRAVPDSALRTEDQGADDAETATWLSKLVRDHRGGRACVARA